MRITLKHPIAKLAFIFATIALPFLRADTVETTDGSKIQGKVLKIEGGVVEIETVFAGVLKVKQAAVAAIATDAPVYLRYKGGNTIQGPLVTTGGEVRVAGSGANGVASLANVEAVWLVPDQSPEAKAQAAMKRKWAFSASVDLLGRSGNSDNFSSAFSFTAVLASPQDKLGFFANYARAQQKTATGTSQVTADQAKAGIDYSSNFSSTYSWYVREEIGTDKIQDLKFYSNTAAGVGFDLVKTKPEVLTFRAGIGERYESYANGTNTNSPGLDIALIHDYTGRTWHMGNKLKFLPAFKDFSNYRLGHESFIETPLAASLWKIRFGVANDYNSVPQPSKKRLDTMYFTQLVLDWK